MNIGQAAKLSDVTAKMIRYYESIGLIGLTSRTDSGYRQYRDSDVQTLRFIKRSRELGFSIARIRTLLGLWQDRSRKSVDVQKLAIQYIGELDRDIMKLQTIRDQIQYLAKCCRADALPDCPILDDLAR